MKVNYYKSEDEFLKALETNPNTNGTNVAEWDGVELPGCSGCWNCMWCENCINCCECYGCKNCRDCFCITSKSDTSGTYDLRADFAKRRQDDKTYDGKRIF